jgi:arylsulfatase A-like enzyme
VLVDRFFAGLVARAAPALLLVCMACPEPGPAGQAPRLMPSGPPPDVLLVVLDTVRADRLSTYGHVRATSPQLDLLAEAGVVFEDVTAPASWTWPSHASLFTGLPPWKHGAHMQAGFAGASTPEGEQGTMPLDPKLPTLAETLGAAGYQTVALSANPYLEPKLGLMRGFGRAEVLPDKEVVAQAEALLQTKGDAPLFVFVNLMRAHAPWGLSPAPWSAQHEALLIGDSAPEFVKKYRRASPFMLDLYQEKVPGEGTGFERLQRGELVLTAAEHALIMDLYDGELAAADYQLSRIVSAWTAQRPEGVVIVTSDHGELMGEHGLWEHGKTVYPELTRVPLVIAAPGRLPAGHREQMPVQLHDLYPTILALTGAAKPAWSLLDAGSGMPRPGPIQAKSYASARWARSVGGLLRWDWTLNREGQWAKLQASQDGLGGYFNINDDPWMAAPAAPPDAERARLDTHTAEQVEPPSTSAVPLSIPDAVHDQLRALGYVAD